MSASLVGSEMCIRDSFPHLVPAPAPAAGVFPAASVWGGWATFVARPLLLSPPHECYTAVAPPPPPPAS
eukprot:7516371-Alexandrium_andersonii.AAC.1